MRWHHGKTEIQHGDGDQFVINIGKKGFVSISYIEANTLAEDFDQFEIMIRGEKGRRKSIMLNEDEMSALSEICTCMNKTNAR